MAYPWLDCYLREKPGTVYDFKEEWQWHRYLVGGKRYAAICLNDEGACTLVTLKLDPGEGDFLRQQYPGEVIPGYYMNKLHWNSVLWTGSVPDEIVRRMADQSYALVLGSLPRRIQRELEGRTD